MAPTFGDTTASEDSKRHVEAMIQKYAHGLSELSSRPRVTRKPDTTENVLLTGSTGNLGSEILVKLLSSERVARVYALNRRSSRGSILDRHVAQLRSKGLDTAILKSPKLVFVEGDTTLANLGLTEAVYSDLHGSITAIIHNAWSINLARGLAFFEPMLVGLRNLIDVARSASSRFHIRFVFISSVTSAFSWDYTQGPSVPEEVIYDSRVALGSGYSESKYVAEQVISQSGLDASALRVCQLTGRLSNGAWPITEWIPIVVRTSLEMGAFPNMEGLLSWIPVDVMAACVLDVALSPKPLPVILNVTHPRPVKWMSLFRVISEATRHESGGRHLPYLSFSDWVSMLERRARTSTIEPGARLLGRFTAFAVVDDAIIATGRQDVEHICSRVLSTSKMEAISPTLRDLKPISTSEIQRWVEYWRAMGFIQPTMLRSGL